MKKYLLGLGAMVVGAGLMFVMIHGEVSAESELNKKLKAVSEPKKPEPFVCSDHTTGQTYYGKVNLSLRHCETKTLDCALGNGSLSCIKKGLFR